MNRRVKKILLLLLAAALFFGAGRVQQSLNRDRDTLGLTRAAVLDNAPPMLAFTTVALGGFRGLISNYLWMRATDLQQDDKFFEAAQLADWITQLEPTTAQVWIFQAWNMAYNISVKFKENKPGDYSDRWHWVERGISLLRDDGLRYNPNSTLIYRELGWFFQHKIGANLDDGNMYYKFEWAGEMKNFFGPNGTNFDRLLHPQTAEDFHQLEVLTNQYKIDPAFAKAVDDKYGPFDWRLPEAHAIYWGAKALDEAAKHPDKANPDDLVTARRLIYQPMLQMMYHGRIYEDPYTHQVTLGPNLDVIARESEAYDELWADEPTAGQKDGIRKAKRNFLRSAVYYLYEANRIADAEKWFKYLGEQYPDQPIIDDQPNSLPKNLTLDEYAVAVVQSDIGDMSQDRVTAAIEGILLHGYHDLALGDDDRYVNFQRLASLVYDHYVRRTANATTDRIRLMALSDMKNVVVHQLLDPQNGVPYAARAQLVTRLNLPASALQQTNAPATDAEAAPTSAPATNAPPQ